MTRAQELAQTPLPSPLRTPEQMAWIHDHFKLDGLERLARADRDYADAHGYYLSDVAALAHAALLAGERARALRERVRSAMIDARAQELRAGHDAEFWRGRGGAMQDALAWLDDALGEGS